MKTSNLILLLMVITASALRAESSQTPISEPDFMTTTQLAAWSQQKHEKAMAAQAAAESATQFAPSLFYTSKPYLTESGTYSFLARQYNPEMARWTTADLSGFPDGPNNRIYVPNPIDEFDSLGSQVSMIYSISAETLSIKSNGGATVQFNNMASGDNNIANEGIYNGGGPIPVGTYSVFSWNQFNTSYSTTGCGAFILDPNDSKTLNDQWDGQYGNRYGFRLHEGSGVGCITANNSTEFNQIFQILLNTDYSETTLYTIHSTGGNTNDKFYEFLLGSLNVVE